MVRATPIPPQQVASQSGGHEQFDGVSNRSDDDLGPVDLPDRTDQIVRQHLWKDLSIHKPGFRRHNHLG
jgi:hypothetical protein